MNRSIQKKRSERMKAEDIRRLYKVTPKLHESIEHTLQHLDNTARRNVKRISESLVNRRKRRVYADNRHIPSHGNHLSFNPSHTKNDLKKTKFRPTTGSR